MVDSDSSINLFFNETANLIISNYSIYHFIILFFKLKDKVLLVSITAPISTSRPKRVD